MRKLLLLLLAVVLPLKSVAAAVVPITGGWAHTQHTAHAACDSTAGSIHATHVHGGIPHAHQAAGDGQVLNAAQTDPTQTSTLHDHPCPHMGMACMTGVTALVPATYAAPALPVEPSIAFDSVVQEVPSPPPTFLR
ncbi:MAG TPA: hypothetical protein VFR86_23415 [Burkholderiaceae bacterium]|nr:hypothetical protein [Burkholderiaceae bacterium]